MFKLLHLSYFDSHRLLETSGWGVIEDRVPGAPTIGAATYSGTHASVAFTAPASDGGLAITSYTATSNPGAITGTCAASPCVVIALTNGTAYTFTVTATNSAGTGAASAASNSVTIVPVPVLPLWALGMLTILLGYYGTRRLSK